MEGNGDDSGTVATPTPRPTLLLTIPPYLLQPEETQRPTLLLTIPPYLHKPEDTPRPTSSVSTVPTDPQTDFPTSYFPTYFQTNPPTNPPTKPPTNPPTNSPTHPPTNPPTNPPTLAQNAVCTDGFKWHRGKPSEGSKCTNDLVYPRAWDDPQITDKYLFDTPDKCCLAHFTLDTCTVVNACSEQQTVLSSSSETSDLVSMTETMPSPSNSSNCSGKRRKPCKLDPNCQWKRFPDRECVVAA